MTKRKRTGRPEMITPEMVEAICGFLRDGLHRQVAAEAAGVSSATLRRWLTIGKKSISHSRRTAKEALHRELYRGVRKAEGQAESVWVLRVAKASEADWKAAAWLLARKMPERWAEQSRRQVELTGANGGPVRTLDETLQEAMQEAAALSPEAIIALAKGTT